ncbi:MAG: aminotransferase class I/II-fold pyridoxal phosphate-dependent enzyme [Euryarchaeota archaeon]|nr:aminotransferase class I/II-fold pyridoxal phosphate-dependent enzyme [Euryarchaeota archaeon]
MLRAAKNALQVEYAIRDVVLPAREMEKQGIEILKLNIGDPCAYDFDTPQHIKDALIDAVQKGKNGYSPSEGIPELRDAIVAREKRRNNVAYTPEDVCVTTGVTESLQMLYASVLEPGDEVLVPGPSYPPYTSLAKLYHSRAISYRTKEESGWQPDVDDLRKRITPRTKIISLINPNNPTGSVWGRRVLEGIAGLAGEYGKQLFLVSDEIYDEMTFDVKHNATASLAKDIPIVTFNGLSKIYLAPGWRIGWTLFRDHNGALADVRKAYMNQARLRLCASTIAQHGAVAALNGPQDHVPKVVAKLKARRDLAHKRLNEIPGVSCARPDGAFYAFPKINALEEPGAPWRNDKEFVLDVLREAHVLMVHGSGFDSTFGNNHFRVVILPPEEEPIALGDA